MALTSRDRITAALAHQELERIPQDAGGCNTTGIHASVVYELRQAFKLDKPNTPVKVVECGQMLGEVAPDLLNALGIDTVALRGPASNFGFQNNHWKEWKLHSGVPVLVPAAFNTDFESDGTLLQYPQGDRSAPACALMPENGWFFDNIVRQPPIDEDHLNPADNVEEFGPISETALDYFKTEAERLYTSTDKAIVASFGGSSFGDVGRLPAPNLKHPKGIRDIEEWYVTLQIRPEYVTEVFKQQCDIALANYEHIYKAVGNKVSVVYITGADFGSQSGMLVSRRIYRDLFMPVHKRMNEWVHKNTPWKTLIHSCGGIYDIIEDIIEAGFDALNPVQCSAVGMVPEKLKENFGKRITFWGGGIDTQQTLPFETPDDVRKEVRERIRVFAPKGGFVFNPVHNIQAQSPLENLLAMYEEVRKPLR